MECPSNGIVVGDIGGTKSNLAYMKGSPRSPEVVHSATYPTRSADSLEALIRRFFHESGLENPWGICLGFAGIVGENKAQATNMPWDVDIPFVRNNLGIRNFHLINDLVAMACSIPHLDKNQVITLQEGSAKIGGTIGLLAAGTGLGEAFLAWTGVKYIPVPTEGGHKDFAPRTPREFRFHQYLAKKYGHVSVERVLSGTGLIDGYTFLLGDAGLSPSSRMTKLLEEGNASAVTEAALGGTDQTAALALDLFISLYGAEAGNVALQALTTSGLYIGGGIAPKMLAALQWPVFLKSFQDKGRMKPFMENVPVRVIMDDKAPLWGAATYLLESRL